MSFDDLNLVSHSGLVPVMALAQRAGFGGLVAENVRPGGLCGLDAHLKVACLVAGMAAGARLDRRHGCATRRAACIARVGVRTGGGVRGPDGLPWWGSTRCLLGAACAVRVALPLSGRR